MAKESSNGVSIVGLLGIVFVTLKLCGVLKWSWWYVTLPFWGLSAIFLAIAIFCLIVAGVVKVFEK